MKKIIASGVLVAVLMMAQPTYAAGVGIDDIISNLTTQLKSLVEKIYSYVDGADDTQFAQVAATIAEEKSGGKAFGPFGADVTAAKEGRGVFVGELVTGFADDFDAGTATQFYYLHDKVTNIILELKPDGELPPGIEAGATVKAVGRVKGGRMDIDTAAAVNAEGSLSVVSSEGVMETAQAATSVNTIAGVLVNFTDKNLTCTPNQIRGILFDDPGNNLADAYLSASNGEMTFTGDVLGPYTIPYPADAAYNNSWWTAVQAAALADGHDLNTYDFQTVITPPVSGMADGYGWYNSGLSFILKCATRDAYQHEVGHNMNLAHSGVGSNVYGDTSSYMGYAGIGLRHAHAYQLDYLNWIPDAAVVSAGPGTYTLSSSDKYPGSVSYPQALKISKPDTSQYYYVSYRTPTGYANNMPSTYDNTTQIHLVGPTNMAVTKLVKSLSVGETWTDAVNSISLTLEATVPGESATVRVATECTRNTPTVSISPGEVGGSPGGTANYSVSVKNNDSAYCGAANISLSSSDTSSNLSTSLSKNSVTLSPGSSEVVTLTATADNTLSGGSHTITVAANSNGKTGSDTSLFTVDAIAPSTPTNVTASTNRKQINVTWNSSTDNIAVVSYNVYRDGQLIGTTQSTSYADKYPVSGTNTYTVSAVDAAGNVSAMSDPASTDFSNGGGKGGGKNGGGSDGGSTDGGGKPDKCTPWPNCR